MRFSILAAVTILFADTSKLLKVYIEQAVRDIDRAASPLFKCLRSLMGTWVIWGVQVWEIPSGPDNLGILSAFVIPQRPC